VNGDPGRCGRQRGRQFIPVRRMDGRVDSALVLECDRVGHPKFDLEGR
jgi:hypothetical protein